MRLLYKSVLKYLCVVALARRTDLRTIILDCNNQSIIESTIDGRRLHRAIRAKAEQLVDVAPRRGELQLVELRPRGCRADEPRN